MPKKKPKATKQVTPKKVDNNIYLPPRDKEAVEAMMRRLESKKPKS